MVKGTTTIELTDIETGEVQKIEEHNYFTNAYHDLCQPIMRNQDLFINTWSAVETQITFRELTRGLLLFNQNLGDDPDNYFPPAFAKMIGHGADITYAGSDLTLGSYSTSQSDLSVANTSKMVWDFTAEQANGTIESVCLTTRCGGMIGYGTPTDGETGGTYKKMLSNFHRSTGLIEYSEEQSYMRPIYLSFKNDYVIVLKMNSLVGTGVMQFEKVDMWTGKANIFKDVPIMSSVTSTNKINNYMGTWTSVDKIELNLSSVLGTGNYYGMAQDGKYLYVTQSNSSSPTHSTNGFWKVDEKIKIAKINLETLTHEVIEVTNTTGHALAIYSSLTDNNREFQFAVCDNYLFAATWHSSNSSGGAKLFAINLSDNTNVKQVKDSKGEEKVIYATNTPNMFTMNLFGKACFSYGNKYANQRDANYTVNTLKCVSTVDFISNSLLTPDYGLVSTYAATEESFALNNYYAFPTDNPLYYGYTKGNSNYASGVNSIYFYICFFPNVLMTINNLSTPVTKTSSQTMRVTYTISKEETP